MGFWHCSCSWSKVPLQIFVTFVFGSVLSMHAWQETDHWSFRSPCTWCSSRWTCGWSGCIRSMFLTGMAEIHTFQRSFFNMSKGCDDVIMAGCFARRTAKGVSRSWWWRHIGLHFDAFCVSCDMLLFCFIQRPKDRVHTFRKYEKVLSRRTWNLQRA